MKWLYVAVSILVVAVPTNAQDLDAVRAAVAGNGGPYLDTLRELVTIESGSRDIDGLNEIAGLVANRLRMLRGEVELLQPDSDGVRFPDTPEELGPMVKAEFRGTGSARILLLAHMDTVYERGMAAAQPFRIEGDRAYGLGIADDKHGIALILHTLEILNALEFREYGILTVLINSDEELSSPASRNVIEQLGREHDVVFSCEGSGLEDRIRLATSGIGAISLQVTGRASHAGNAPENGRNALYELAHHIMRMRDLSQDEIGLKLNWTLAQAGAVRNAIPAYAEATADVRVLRVSDWDAIERRVREIVMETLIPDTEVEVVANFRRPPLEVNDNSHTMASHVAQIYEELGRSLEIATEPSGGGTDAAFAGLRSDAAVIEGMSVNTFGAHSNNAEYIVTSSIEPRLYLLTRSIMDVSNGLAPVP